MFCAVGGIDVELGSPQLKELLAESLVKLGRRERVLAVPPDITRLHSQAGVLTCAARELLGDRLKAVLPAIGTHAAMTPEQMDYMFPGVPHELFHVHNWRTDVETLGEVPAEFILEQSEGKLNVPWQAQTNRLISQGGFDLILSIGQVVPHEVIGMANYNKNILIGAGGRQSINLSHYLGAVYGMERIMGRAENPVRAVLNYASDLFLRELPIVYVQTVVGRRADGGLAVRGLVYRRRCGVLPSSGGTEPEGKFRAGPESRSKRPWCILIRTSFIRRGWETRLCIARAWRWPMARS